MRLVPGKHLVLMVRIVSLGLPSPFLKELSVPEQNQWSRADPKVQKDGFPGRDSWEIAARGRPSLGCTLDVRQVRWNTAAVPQVAWLPDCRADRFNRSAFLRGKLPSTRRMGHLAGQLYRKPLYL